MKDILDKHFAATICFIGIALAKLIIVTTLLLDGTLAELAANLPF